VRAAAERAAGRAPEVAAEAHASAEAQQRS
jgi:hypothetical protein